MTEDNQFSKRQQEVIVFLLQGKSNKHYYGNFVGAFDSEEELDCAKDIDQSDEVKTWSMIPGASVCRSRMESFSTLILPLC